MNGDYCTRCGESLLWADSQGGWVTARGESATCQGKANGHEENAR